MLVPPTFSTSLSTPSAHGESSDFLTLSVNVRRRLCVVVGSGGAARRKISSLLHHGAQIRLVAPASEPDGLTGVPLDQLDVVRRSCESRDLKGARLVIAATNQREENRRIALMAADMGILALQVDSPEDSDFHFPASLRVGDLTVSFSTGGASAAFAARLRDEAAAIYGPPHAEFCRLARSVRTEATASVSSEVRARLLQHLVESDALDLLTRGHRDAARARVQDLLTDALLTVAAAPPEARGMAGHSQVRQALVGKVFLVGAGPGDPGLLTVKGARCLRMADTVFCDGLVNRVLLELCPANVKSVDVSKRKGCRQHTQQQIIEMLIEEARLGRIVVRLKGGDPLVFGRGGEEARALRRAGIPFEIVPGVSSVTAVPAYAGIPVTDRDFSSSFAAYTVHRKGGLSLTDEEWRRVAQGAGTLVFLMGKTRCEEVVQKLIRFGRASSTPAAMIFNGTTPQQKTVVGTLGSIVEEARTMDLPGPGLVVVGDVVNAIGEMSWFDDTGARQGIEARVTCPIE